MRKRWACVLMRCSSSVTSAAQVAAQVQTEVPPVVPGAKPVDGRAHQDPWRVTPGKSGRERRRPRRRSCSCRRAIGRRHARRYPVVYALHGYSIGAEQWSTGNSRAPDHRGRVRAGRKGNDRRPAGFEDACTTARCTRAPPTTGDFESYIARDVVALHGCSLPHDPRAAQPRPGGPLDGRVRGHPHRHEARRCVRQPLHHESVLPVAAPGCAREPRSRQARWRGSSHRRRRRSCRSPFARSSRWPPRGRPT